MMRSTDLYAALGVAPSASQDEIRKTYKRLARQYHPDLNPADAESEERFKEISVAFDVLSDPDKRKLYDEFGEEAIRIGFDAQRARAHRDWQTWGSAGQRHARGVSGGVGLEDLFGSVFRRSGGRVQQGPRRGSDLEARMTISLREAVLGTQRQMTFERPEPFEALGGPSPASRPLQLEVKIPAGIEDGQRIRLAGQGRPGSAGGPAGDLLIQIDVAPHPLVRREGRDLHLDLPVTVSEAMLGAKIEVPTFDGTVTLTIPAGSQGGSRLRLRAKGMPATKGKVAGDLYVRLAIRVPDPAADPDAAKEAATKLDAAYRGDVRGGLVL